MLDPFSATAERNIKALARDVNCPGGMRSLSQSHMPCLIDVDSKKKEEKTTFKSLHTLPSPKIGTMSLPHFF